MARASTGSRANEERETSKRIGALAALWPFVRPYRVMMGFAIVALVATATVSLVLRRYLSALRSIAGQVTGPATRWRSPGSAQ